MMGDRDGGSSTQLCNETSPIVFPVFNFHSSKVEPQISGSYPHYKTIVSGSEGLRLLVLLPGIFCARGKALAMPNC